MQHRNDSGGPAGSPLTAFGIRTAGTAAALAAYLALLGDRMDKLLPGHDLALGVLALLYVLWTGARLVRQARRPPAEPLPGWSDTAAGSGHPAPPGDERLPTLADTTVFGVPLYVLVPTQVTAATLFVATGARIAAYVFAVILVAMASAALAAGVQRMLGKSR